MGDPEHLCQTFPKVWEDQHGRRKNALFHEIEYLRCTIEIELNSGFIMYATPGL